MNRDSENNSLQMDRRNTRNDSSIKKAEKIQTPTKPHSPIVSFSGKKRKFRFSPRKLILPLISIFTAYLLLSLYLENALADQILELAQTQAEKELLETVHQAIGRMAKKGELNYDDLITTIHDENGQVTYLDVNTARLSQARAELVREIDKSLQKENKMSIRVPLGSLAGWNLFSGMGFPVRVRIHPIGITNGQIDTVLEDCGINQSRHLIRLRIRSKLVIILPNENTEVETELVLPMSEKILVGDVPEIYLEKIG